MTLTSSGLDMPALPVTKTFARATPLWAIPMPTCGRQHHSVRSRRPYREQPKVLALARARFRWHFPDLERIPRHPGGPRRTKGSHRTPVTPWVSSPDADADEVVGKLGPRALALRPEQTETAGFLNQHMSRL